MRLSELCFLLCGCLSVLVDTGYSEPFTLSALVAAGTAAVWAYRPWNLPCQFFECCSNEWVHGVKPNITGLESTLESRLYGQHLVTDTVVRAIAGHLRNDDPDKALVLSFHGGTGIGKNYVSRIIAEHLYTKGMKSKYVHIWPATLHFTHPRRIEEYKDQLRGWIETNVTACERSLFIFDEMDKLPHSLLDVLKPYLDHHIEVNKINYRRSIFLFLSNTAGDEIIARTRAVWESGKKRETITRQEMEELILLPAYNDKDGGGLWHSALIESHLISAFIPFLPLERDHVKKCIIDNLREKRRSIQAEDPKFVAKIADELQYMPTDLKLFSKSGCKRVTEKVDFHLYY